ncbi:MAG TPA: hypothetical protein ENF29_02550 [Candidatus Acetothermia bacterium]|nr:hypothetical protein [Candidatus Acetothermia bacterium]
MINLVSRIYLLLIIISNKVREMVLSEVEQFLRASGKRVTSERRLILRIIEENPHLDASEIYALARKEDPKISLSTVYRTMTMLKELKLVEASDLGEDHDHYEVRLQEHYHLICLGCGRVIEIPPSDAITRLGEESGFEVVGVKLEIFGYCEECQKKRSSPGLQVQPPTVKAGKMKDADLVIDLRGIPRLQHPEVVSRKADECSRGDIIEIVCDDPVLDIAPQMLERIGGLKLLAVWKEGRVCHAQAEKL